MTEIFLGAPPANIKQWIIEHTTATGHADTWYKYANDTEWRTVSITGTMDCQALVAAGLMPEGAGTQMEPGWITQPVEVEIGTAVTNIWDYVFLGCSELTSVTIPDSVTTIGYQAFTGCTNLTSVTIPNSVTSIWDYAFQSCSKLTSVTIPDSVTSIREYAFGNCGGLASVTIVANGGNAENVRQMMIKNGVPLNIIWNMPSHPETRFTLQGGTVETPNITGTLDIQWMITNGYWISDGEYWEKEISYADIGNTVTSIGEQAFYGCASLTSVTIPDSVTSIGDAAFKDCMGLTNVAIPDDVTSIGWGVFYQCENLMNVIFFGKTMQQVQDIEDGRGNKLYPFGLNWANENGVTIHCSDGDLTVSHE